MTRREVSNRFTGERIVFTRTAEETGGESVTFDFFLEPTGGVEFEHYHALQSETFRMRKGALTLKVAGEKRTLREGEEITLAPGTPHSLRNDMDGPIELEVEYRPALRSQEWLLLSHAAWDQLGREPTLLEMAPHLSAGVEIYPASPPRWMVRALFAVLAPLARLLGKQRVMPEAAEAWFAAREGREASRPSTIRTQPSPV